MILLYTYIHTYIITHLQPHDGEKNAYSDYMSQSKNIAKDLLNFKINRKK